MSEEEKQLVSQADFEAHKKETHKQLVQSAMLTFTAFLAIAAVCIAWFINNTAVSGGGVQVQTEGSRFVLASTGDKGRFDTDTTAFVTGTKATIQNVDYYLSNSSTVAWMLSNDSNIRNQTGGEAILSPGSSGSITFYVIKKAEDINSVEINLSLLPYAVVKEQSQNSIKIDDKTFVEPLDKTAGVNSAVYELVNGHILFFREKTGNYYSNWVNETFTVDLTGKAVDTPIPITLYWVWPFQFRQYVNTGSGNLFADIASEDYTKMLTDMKKTSSGVNYNKYFYAPTATELGAITLDNLTAANMATYSAYYNSADEAIGSNASYLMLELVAKELETTP